MPHVRITFDYLIFQIWEVLLLFVIQNGVLRTYSPFIKAKGYALLKRYIQRIIGLRVHVN